MAAVRRLNQQLHPESSQYSDSQGRLYDERLVDDDSYNALMVASGDRPNESGFLSVGDEDHQFRLASLNSSGEVE